MSFIHRQVYLCCGHMYSTSTSNEYVFEVGKPSEIVCGAKNLSA